MNITNIKSITNITFSNSFRIILANTGPRDDLIDTPSHCSYNALSDEKAVFVQESTSNFFVFLFFNLVFINFLL